MYSSLLANREFISLFEAAIGFISSKMNRRHMFLLLFDRNHYYGRNISLHA